VRRAGALLGALASLAVPAGAGAAAPDVGGFHSVLGLGQGQTVNAVDLAAYEAPGGQAPASFTNQLEMYSGVSRAAPHFTAADLDRFYKNSGFGQLPGGQASSLSPKPGVTIVRDRAFNVPRITGVTRSDTFFGAGYATAQDRLFLMDVLRHIAEGRSAELLGAAAAKDDSTQLGDQDFSAAELDKEVDDLPAVLGPEGAQGKQDIADYVEGINAYITDADGDPTKLPAEYPALGVSPAPWTRADTVALAIFLIGQFTVNGGGERQQAEVLAEFDHRFGAKNGRRVYEDFRRAEDPEAPVVADRTFKSDRPGKPVPAANVLPDRGSIKPRNAIVSGPGAEATARSLAALPSWARTLATNGLPLHFPASNAVLVTGAHSVSGRPLASMGPQVSYYSPEILVEQELHGPGIDVSGMTFPGGSPYPLIGHGIDFAWTGTTANGDTRDTFAEELCEPDGSAPTLKSTHYRYRGRCIPFVSRDVVIKTPVAPTSPEPPQTITLRTLRSIHGPVSHLATENGKPVALTNDKSPNGRSLRSLLPFKRLAENGVHDPASFEGAFRHFTGSENWFYIDDKHISWFNSGLFPRHAKGTDLDLPIRGTGPYDWRGDLPPSANPRVTDPKKGYVLSWNNKEARGWRAPAGTFSFGPLQRSRLLERPLRLALKRGKLDLASLSRVTLQAATADLRGTEVVSWLERAIGKPPDADTAKLLALLDDWRKRGSQRRDLDNDGNYDDSPAVALIDAWWPRLVRGIFQPALGADVVEAVSKVNVLDARPNVHFFFDGWWGYVQKDLRTVLKRKVRGRFSRRYCGGGSLKRCRAVLVQTLRDAAADVRGRLGADPAGWKVATLCPTDVKPLTCDEIVPTTAGAVATPPIPFHNRGTFHQAVEVQGRRQPG
jgi:acyl-homoserine lactone acylase PvdQ